MLSSMGLMQGKPGMEVPGLKFVLGRVTFRFSLIGWASEELVSNLGSNIRQLTSSAQSPKA
jgi:hypothetical protein